MGLPMIEIYGIPLETIIMALFILIAILIIILIIKMIVILLPAVLVAGVVWLITRDTFLTGLAFLLVALVALIKRL